MTGTGLRAEKKAATRRRIADTAARLFGERGYDAVAVADVARAAGFAQQTVYNYFPTKQDLVLDRTEEIADTLVRLVEDRPAGTSPAAALRPAVSDELDRLRGRTRGEVAGDLPVLCATSPAIRRLTLEARDQQARAVAAAIRRTTPDVDPVPALVQATALLSVLQALVDETGPRLREGADPAAVADDVEPALLAAMDDLATRWP